MADQALDNFWNLLRDVAVSHMMSLWEFLMLLRQERLMQSWKNCKLVLDKNGPVMRIIPIVGTLRLNAQALAAAVEDEDMLMREGINHFSSLLGDFPRIVRDRIINEIRARRVLPRRLNRNSKSVRRALRKLDDLLEEVRDQLDEVFQDFLRQVVREAIRHVPSLQISPMKNE